MKKFDLEWIAGTWTTAFSGHKGNSRNYTNLLKCWKIFDNKVTVSQVNDAGQIQKC